MYTKVQASSKNDGNKGSCRDLVYYLEKENRAESRGEEMSHSAETFFSHTKDQIPAEQVIHAIDYNTKKLGKDDSKFFEIYVSPSSKELNHIAEDINSLKEYIRKEVMESYAAGFGIRNGKTLKAEDLVYFGKVEHERRYKGSDPQVINGQYRSGDIKAGMNTHVHILVSRKDESNKIKLSPMASERGDTGNAVLNGKIVQRGFNRTSFSEKAEMAFDSKFDFKRRLNQSFDYLNTMKHGDIQHVAEIRKRELAENYEQKKEQVRQNVQNTPERIPSLSVKKQSEESSNPAKDLSI